MSHDDGNPAHGIPAVFLRTLGPLPQYDHPENCACESCTEMLNTGRRALAKLRGRGGLYLVPEHLLPKP